jgi:hypothetical protein
VLIQLLRVQRAQQELLDPQERKAILDQLDLKAFKAFKVYRAYKVMLVQLALKVRKA